MGFLNYRTKRALYVITDIWKFKASGIGKKILLKFV